MATDNAGRTIWNDKTRSDLLVAVFSIAPPSSQEWESIAVQLRAKGYTYNYSAAMQHLQKLKKKDVDASATPSAPATPKKSGKATAAKAKTPTSGKRKAMIKDNTDEDENDKVDLKKPKFEARDAKLDQSIDGDELQDGEC